MVHRADQALPHGSTVGVGEPSGQSVIPREASQVQNVGGHAGSFCYERSQTDNLTRLKTPAFAHTYARGSGRQIPAGCTWALRVQNGASGESHRPNC
jgi:hypothetical protein